MDLGLKDSQRGADAHGFAGDLTLQEAFAFVEQSPALCWSRSSRRSRAARPRGKRPQRPRATSGDRLNKLRPSARGQPSIGLESNAAFPACIVLVAFGRCL